MLIVLFVVIAVILAGMFLMGLIRLVGTVLTDVLTVIAAVCGILAGIFELIARRQARHQVRDVAAPLPDELAARRRA